MSKILTAMSLRRATLELIEAQIRDGGGEERQPPPRRFVFSDQRSSSRTATGNASGQTLDVWTGQEPGERIANTILLCAIRDRAREVTLTPSDKGVEVRFQISGGVREQKLPAFALAPIVRHFKTLTRDDEAANVETANVETANAEAISGAVRVAVDEQFYNISFSPLPTPWGAGVKVQFSI